jgi:hypothetical protein
MRPLVLQEVYALDYLDRTDRIKDDQPGVVEVVNPLRDVFHGRRIEAEGVLFESRRAVLQAAFFVCQRPHGDPQ